MKRALLIDLAWHCLICFLSVIWTTLFYYFMGICSGELDLRGKITVLGETELSKEISLAGKNNSL